MTNEYISAKPTRHAIVEFTKDALLRGDISLQTPISEIKNQFEKLFAGSNPHVRSNYELALSLNNGEEAEYFIHRKTRTIFVVCGGNIVTCYVLDEVKYQRQYSKVGRKKEVKLSYNISANVDGKVKKLINHKMHSIEEVESDEFKSIAINLMEDHHLNALIVSRKNETRVVYFVDLIRAQKGGSEMAPLNN